MKVFLPLYIVLLLCLTSCQRDFRNHHGIKMDSKEDLTLAMEFINKHLNENEFICAISFLPKEKSGVTKYSDRVKLHCRIPDQDSLNVICFFLKNGERISVNERSIHREELQSTGALKLKDIDLEGIHSYITRAGEILETAAKEYNEPISFNGVGQYDIFFGEDNAALHYFTIESKDEAGSTSSMDRFYEFHYEVVDGKLISKTI